MKITLQLLFQLIYSLHSFSKKMQVSTLASTSEETHSSIIEKIKGAVSHLTWKHALILSIPLGLCLFPKPIIKLFIPIASRLSNNHPNVTCNEHIKEIILTTNEALNFETLLKIKIVKGSKPHLQQYPQNERTAIQLFPLEKKPTLTSSFSAIELQIANEQTVNLYSETLWNNFRLTKLQNPHLKVILIKATQQILNKFLLKFYKMNKNQSHKIGFLNDNKLSILRLDQRVGTYEHLTSEISLK